MLSAGVADQNNQAFILRQGKTTPKRIRTKCGRKVPACDSYKSGATVNAAPSLIRFTYYWIRFEEGFLSRLGKRDGIGMTAPGMPIRSGNSPTLCACEAQKTGHPAKPIQTANPADFRVVPHNNRGQKSASEARGSLFGVARPRRSNSTRANC